jgi:hypothetical protein
MSRRSVGSLATARPKVVTACVRVRVRVRFGDRVGVRVGVRVKNRGWGWG